MLARMRWMQEVISGVTRESERRREEEGVALSSVWTYSRRWEARYRWMREEEASKRSWTGLTASASASASEIWETASRSEAISEESSRSNPLMRLEKRLGARWLRVENSPAVLRRAGMKELKRKSTDGWKS